MYDALVRRVLYPLDRWRTGDATELRYLRKFERSQYWSPEKHAEESLVAIRRLLTHAYTLCPFYQRHFDESGISPGDVRSLKDVSALPILEKPDIRLHRDDMVARNCSKDRLVYILTGGSTATPLSFYATRDRMHSRAAATWRHNRWADWEIGDKCGVIWGAARDAPPATLKSHLRNLLLDRRAFLNTACLTKEKMREFDRHLKKFRPKIILGYTKSVVLFAQYLKCEAISAYQPHAIIATAEVLEDHERILIEEVFGCPIFDRYGCREVSVIASECDQHNGMHVMAEGLYVEIIRNGQPAAPGELGEVVVTDLLNYGMPLIRYRIGDMATVLEGECACGRGLPRLGRLAGRVTDFLIGSDGRLVSGVALGIPVDRGLSLGQVQIVQERRGHLLFKIVPPEGQRPTQGDLDLLCNEAKAYLGYDTMVDFEYVDRIPQEPSGKYRFCISKVENPFAIAPITESG